jgi:hypothetical protein
MSDVTPTEQLVPPAPSENKRIIINSELLNEDAFTLSPEQQTQQERLDQRSALALPIINKMIPARTLDQHAMSITRYPYVRNQPEDVQRAEAARRLGEEPNDKLSLARTIALTEIPEKDFEEYIATAYAIAKELSPDDTGTGINDVGSVIYATETMEQGRMFQKYAKTWRENFLTGVNNETTYSRMHDATEVFKAFSGAGSSKKPTPRTEQEWNDLFKVVVETYKIGYSLPTEEQREQRYLALTTGVRRIGLDRLDADQAQRALTIIKDAVNNPDKKLVDEFTYDVTKYGLHHELTEDAVKGLRDKLYPAMEKKDPQVEILLNGGNIFGMYEGDFGIGDFLVHSYALRVNPANLSELLLAARKVPSTTLARLEANRLDAGSLSRSSAFPSLKEMIHDQRPFTHEVLIEMVQYYDTGNPDRLKEVLSRTDYLKSDDAQAECLDRARYDKAIVAQGHQSLTGENAIDVLRRLRENTEPIPDTPPETSDPKLNQEMQSLAESRTEGAVPKERLGQTLDYVNSMLQDMMARGEIGIEPNHIHALSWLERRAFETMQSLTYEDQSRAYRQDWLVSVLRFQELIGSPHDFNETEFQSFITKLQSSTSDRQAYQLIGTRALESIYQLAKVQSDRGRTDTGGLWSGNLPHELIGLVDPRPAETEVGRRARNEDIKRMTEPGYHPGD